MLELTLKVTHAYSAKMLLAPCGRLLMSLSRRIHRSYCAHRVGFFVALCGLGLVATSPLAHSQTAAKPAARAATPAAPSPLPLLIGGAMGGLLLGAGLGWALKKTPEAVPVESGPDRAFEENPFALAVVNNRERVTHANAPFVAFLGEPEIVGQSLFQSFHPDDLARLRVAMQSVFDGESPTFETQTRLFRADGELKYAQLSIHAQGAGRKPSSVMVALHDMTEQVNAQSDLVGARQAVRSLYEVIGGDRARTLDAKMKALLQMGCSRLELPIGVLGRICDDAAGDRLETLFVESPDRRVRPAMTLLRSQIVEGAPSLEAQLLGLETLPHAGVPGADSHVERNDEIAYLGAPVNVEGRLFGMLSFSGLGGRELPFGPDDVELLRLMSEWVGGEIERENARAALTEQQRELLAANGKLESLATHDGLTEAKNRRAFNEKLAEEWSRAQRYGTPLSLVMFDVDKFKTYNDSFGHQAGDEVLKLLARTVMGLVRTTDFFARYGGEEFALILPNTDADGAYILADRLRERVEKAGWKERPVTASFGVSTLEIGMTSGEDLIEAADKALYLSKERGRNRVTQAVAAVPDESEAVA